MIANPHELLEFAYSPQFKPVEGVWQSIQLRPDFATGELLNIGVLFSEGEKRTARLLKSFDKFYSLYGEAAEDELRFVIRALEVSLSQNHGEANIPSIEFTSPKLARGESSEAIVDRLFSSIVNLGGPKHMPRKEKQRFFNNTYARDEVFQRIRTQVGITAERIIASGDDLFFKDGSRLLALDIPLRCGPQLGTVVSAGFSTPESVERAFLRAFFDLATAMAISKIEIGEVFVYRPDGILTTEKQRRVDNVIDIAEWKLNKLGVHLDVSNSPDKLAQDILSWAYV